MARDLFCIYILVHPSVGKYIADTVNGIMVISDPMAPQDLIIGITDLDFLNMALEPEKISFEYFAHKLNTTGVAVCEI
jgi:hypothetical protein